MFFRKRKKLPGWQDKAAVALAAKIRWLQQKWAAFMNAKMNRLSVQWKKGVVIGFTALSVLVCVRVTFTAKTFVIKTGSIHTIRPAVQEVKLKIPELPNRRIDGFLRYMDSVKGKKIFDSIMRARPGLLDSARLLKRLYHENK